MRPSRRTFSERQIAIIILQIREAVVRAGAKITRQLEIVILPRVGLAPGAVTRQSRRG